MTETMNTNDFVNITNTWKQIFAEFIEFVLDENDNIYEQNIFKSLRKTNASPTTWTKFFLENLEANLIYEYNGSEYSEFFMSIVYANFNDLEIMTTQIQTIKQYLKFLSRCERRVDERYEESKNYSRISRKEWDEQDTYNQPWVNDLAWVNPQIFADTVLSIVSEGNAYDPATNYSFLTEKTWRAVAMRHPFIFSGYPEQFDYAKSLGLCTFEQYMLIKDYAYITDEDKRLDAVVVNTKYFIDNYNQYNNEIGKDIEHNYSLFMELFKKDNKLLNSLAITEYDKEQWFNQTGFSHLLKIQK